MFDAFFGWRKASKCKKLIKQVQCRLKLLKNKRHAIVRQLREDTAQLIKIGHENIAFSRAEQLIEDESIVEAYELLDHFSEFLLIQFSYIRRHKDCPNDINEAVSSLIYASARCGDLPELRVIRKLFEERYGQKFATAAVELLPGNLVNRQVKEKLTIKSISDDVKHKMINEIAKDYCLRPELLALEYYPEWQQQEQVKESSEHKVVLSKNVQASAERSEVKTSNVEIERKTILTEPCRSNSSKDLNTTSTSAISSTVQQASLTVSECPTLNNKAEKFENSAEAKSPNISSTERSDSSTEFRANTQAVALEQKEERIIQASSSESLSKLYEETLVYLDDIEEFKSATTKDEDSQDQRRFKFKSSIQSSKKGNLQNSCERSYSEKYESGNGKPGSKYLERSCSWSKKRPRRRLVSQENQSLKDTGCISYYGQPYKHRFYQQQRNQQKKILVEQTERRLNQFGSSEMGITSLSRNRRCYPKRSCCGCCSDHKMGSCKRRSSSCSLETPSHFCSDDDEDNSDCEVLPQFEQKNLSTNKHCRSDHVFCYDELNSETEWFSIPRRRSCCDINGAMVYDVFTYPDHQIQRRNNGLKGVGDEFGFRGDRGFSCRTRKDSLPPYLRTVTMPPERPRENFKEDFQRCNSVPVQIPNHVHPKLPDYDDITARFMALKKENLLSKLHNRKQQL